MTMNDLDEIQAQVDSTVPYYVPQLIAQCRSLLRQAATDAEALEAKDKRITELENIRNHCADELAVKDAEINQHLGAIERLAAFRDSWQHRAFDAEAALTAERQKVRELREAAAGVVLRVLGLMVK